MDSNPLWSSFFRRCFCREIVPRWAVFNKTFPIVSMYGPTSAIKNQPNVDKYTRHGWYGFCFFSVKYFFSKKLTAKNDETALRKLREPFMHDFSTQWSTNGKLVGLGWWFGIRIGISPSVALLSYGDPIGIQTRQPTRTNKWQDLPKSPDINPTTPSGERRELCTSITETNLKIPEERPN